jgi:hypothetical protein
MGQDIKTHAIGGESFRLKFHEDGAFFDEAMPTASSTVYSDVKDLGETLGGVCIRAYAEEAVTGAGTASIASFAILAGDDKTAAGTDTASWTTVAGATATGTAMYAAGADILKYIPAPGDGKKYYRAAVTVNGTGFGGTITVYNDLLPGR